jgi:hypothetical protein
MYCQTELGIGREPPATQVRATSVSPYRVGSTRENIPVRTLVHLIHHERFTLFSCDSIDRCCAILRNLQ